MKTSTQSWKKTLNLEHEPANNLLELLETLKDDAPSIKASSQTPDLLKGPFTTTDLKTQLEEAMLTSSLKEALEKARKSKGITLRALGQKTGVSAPRVQQVENAETKLELQTLLRHAHALGYDLSIVDCQDVVVVGQFWCKVAT